MNRRIRFARLLIAVPLVLNVLAAISFILDPASYTPAFELSGVPGEVAVLGVGILFLMWNVPYLFAYADPIRHRASHLQAILMQAIGVVGETTITFRYQLAATHPLLASSIMRFIIFDFIGLILLVISWWLLVELVNSQSRYSPVGDHGQPDP